MSERPYLKIWNKIEKEKKQPLFARKLIKIDYKKFEKRVFSNSNSTRLKLVKSLYAGDVYLLKNTFSKKFCKDIIDGAWKINKTTRKSFHKMKNKCKNFHRLIDNKITKKYAYQHIKHAFYFFPWNEDPLNMYEKIYKKWRTYKYLGGFKVDEYENNLPEDSVVDRFQIVHYPAGAGWLETHNDPFHNQRVIISGFLSERGRDFSKGGFYCYKKDMSIIDCEKEIETGDMLIGYATVLHGVSVVDPHIKLDYHNPRGRWFMGLYSNDTDTIKKRKSTISYGKKFPTPSLPLR